MEMAHDSHYTKIFICLVSHITRVIFLLATPFLAAWHFVGSSANAKNNFTVKSPGTKIRCIVYITTTVLPIVIGKGIVIASAQAQHHALCRSFVILLTKDIISANGDLTNEVFLLKVELGAGHFAIVDI